MGQRSKTEKGSLFFLNADTTIIFTIAKVATLGGSLGHTTGISSGGSWCVCVFVCVCVSVCACVCVCVIFLGVFLCYLICCYRVRREERGGRRCV